ncbi:activator-dependent family glycosyltransferase [Rhodococcus qingshengii]|uniref:activator-dependent family glycosyltransferase n=1 Tax=Rhodococcus qingshengii TaxID=334542 RepID=UPI0036DCF725
MSLSCRRTAASPKPRARTFEERCNGEQVDPQAEFRCLLDESCRDRQTLTGLDRRSNGVDVQRQDENRRPAGGTPLRVLFATYSERTHFQAMVPLAWAFAAAGHEVRVASQPALIDEITRSGLTAVPVGSDHTLWRIASRLLTSRFAGVNPTAHARLRGIDLPPYARCDQPIGPEDWGYLRDGYEEVLAGWHRIVNGPMLDDLVAFARQWKPHVVLWEPTTHAGAIAAEAVGAVHGRLLWSLDFFGCTRANFIRLRDRTVEQDGAGVRLDDPMQAWLAADAARHGIAFSERLVSGEFTVDQYPPTLRLETGLDVVGMRYVPYNGPSSVPPWLRERATQRRVCLTLGQMGVERFDEYPVDVSGILSALSDVDAEVIATVAPQVVETFGTVPDNVRIESFVPLAALAPTCSAAVHHGGFGTTNTFVRSGVPQVVIAEQHDAPLLAARIERAGAGRAEHFRTATPESLRDHVTALLDDPRYAIGADKLRAGAAAMPDPPSIAAAVAARVAAQPRRRTAADSS